MAFAALGAALIGGTVAQGQRQKQTERRSLRRQSAAQRQAEQAAIGEQRRSEQERRRLNRRRPEVDSLLTGQQRASRGGAASTLLTGPAGVNPGRLSLGGGGSLLGGG